MLSHYFQNTLIQQREFQTNRLPGRSWTLINQFFLASLIKTLNFEILTKDSRSINLTMLLGFHVQRKKTELAESLIVMIKISNFDLITYHFTSLNYCGKPSVRLGAVNMTTDLIRLSVECRGNSDFDWIPPSAT